MRWLRRLGAGGKGVAGLDQDLRTLIDENGLAAFDRQLAFGDVVGERDWVLDLDAGQLRLGGDIVLPAQVVGTTDAANDTWLWAWANPNVPEPLAARAREAAEVGRARAMNLLVEPELDIGRIDDGHLLALAVSGLLDADAYYRCPHDSGEVFVLIEVPEARRAKDLPALHAASVVSEALLGIPQIVTKRGVANYLRGLGLGVTETDGHVEATGGDVSFEFDGHGRLAQIAGLAGPAELAVSPPVRLPSGVPLNEWTDTDFTNNPSWRDERGRSPVDVLREYQTRRHAWEKHAARSRMEDWPATERRLVEVFADVATPRPMVERDTSYGQPPSRDPALTRIVAISSLGESGATVRLEEDDRMGSLDDIEVRLVRPDGVWLIDDRVAIYGEERVPGLL